MCVYNTTSNTALLFGLSQTTYKEALTRQVLSEHHQRVYVERAKPLEQYTTEEPLARFHFGKADINITAGLVRPKRRTQRSHSLSVGELVIIAHSKLSVTL